jgi:hypothetical protein
MPPALAPPARRPAHAKISWQNDVLEFQLIYQETALVDTARGEQLFDHRRSHDLTQRI